MVKQNLVRANKSNLIRIFLVVCHTLIGLYLFAGTDSNIQVLFDANCNGGLKVFPTNPSSCGGNGQIQVQYQGISASQYRSRINGGSWTTGNVTYTNRPAGQYSIEIQDVGTGNVCRNLLVTLFYRDPSIFSGRTIANASNCGSTGSITFNNIATGVEISHLTFLTRSYTSVSGSSHTISNLSPGTYGIRLRRISNPFCYIDTLITVGPNNCESTGLCGTSLGVNRFPNGDFGSGSNTIGPPLSPSETNYFFAPMTCDAPDDGAYTIINTSDCNGASSGGGIFGGAFEVLTQDHTPADVGGYMMLVNASYAPDIAFQKEISGLCPNTEYQFSAWIYNIQPQAGIKPNLTFLIDGIGRYTTGNITSTGWQNIGFRFRTGSGSNSIFSIRNNNPGGQGNDWVIDDIFVGICEPLVTIAAVNTCVGTSDVVASATITDAQQQFSWYKWQFSDNGGTSWSDATAAAQGTFSANSYSVNLALPSPIPNSIAGRIYRVNIATSSSNLGSAICSALSSNALTISNLNAGSIASNQTVCQGGDPAAFTSISASGSGTLSYQWQSSTASATTGFGNIGSATGATYNPPAGLMQTTYYRRAVTSSTGGCTAYTQPVVVEVNIVLPGTISSSQTICTGGTPNQIQGTN